jgi:hypothetical protein
MVDLSIADSKLVLHVRGADKLRALKSSLEIPLAHIAGVRADPEIARGWYHGIRMPGTNVPGVITARTKMGYPVRLRIILGGIPKTPLRQPRQRIESTRLKFGAFGVRQNTSLFLRIA